MPKKTVEAIVVGGNDYVIQVKGNQKHLKEAILSTMGKQKPDEQFLNKEQKRGRRESRHVYLYKNVTEPEFKKWIGLNDVIAVKRSGFRDEKEYENWHYYISSRSNLNAKAYAEVIRKHWYIENKLHWVKDVIMYEDKSRIKDKANAANQSIIRNMIINLYRLNGDSSLKQAIENHANKLEECLKILIFNKYIINSSE